VTPGPDSLGVLLRGHRHAAGLTLEELAAGAGVSVRAISDMERGHSNGPQARTMQALADALNLAGPERAVLLAVARAGRRRPREPVPGLCDLPPDIPDFVGRSPEVAWLTDRTDTDPLQTAVVSGAPGLGKTALAVHAAHLMAPQYSDGCHFINLRGLDAEPVTPHEALRRLLGVLGVREPEIPLDTEERQVLYRRLIRDKRVLIVLDNAAYEAQVRLLLPDPGHSTVWITSRRALTGITHARRLPLQPLTPDAATTLLTSMTSDRDNGDPSDTAALQDIAERCGHLPLALRIAGNRLLSRPAWKVRDLADRLVAEDLRLDRLTAGDLRIQSAFNLSYDQLSEPLRALFRRLALVPGPDFGPALGAVLTGLARPEVEQLLDELVELGLLLSTTGDRAAFHDLIRLYAHKQLHTMELPKDVSATRDRMNSWLLDTAVEAGQWFEPRHHETAGPADARADLTSQQAAHQWLETEDQNWFAAFRDAAQAGQHDTVVRVAESMHWFSDWTVHWGHWPEVFALSCAAAHELGDPRTEAVHLNYAAWSRSACLGDFEGAEIQAHQARRLARQAGDTVQEAWALNYAARAARNLGRLEDALTYNRQAVTLFQQAGDKEGHPQALLGVAINLRGLERPSESLPLLQQVLGLVTDPVSAPAPHIADFITRTALSLSGRAHASLGDYEQATTSYRAALEAGPRISVPDLHGRTLRDLGRALHHRQEFEQARTAMEQAREYFLTSGNTAEETETDEELQSWQAQQDHP
jgi:tetratricopeptide (TPR) repeat protein/transcriptional regulator with XRE-family HTH domain